MRLLLTILSLLFMVGCGTRPSTNKGGDVASESYPPGTRRMERTITSIDTEEEYIHALKHFWDGFDFSIGERVEEYSTEDIFFAMADYAMLLPREGTDTLLRGLMHRAEASRPVLDLFATVAEMVFHDPNSPLRNDELYIPILEVLVATPHYDEFDRIAPAYDLDMALKNRIGMVANNFLYTLADGTTHHLHDITSAYTIIMFSNPGCPMCRDIRHQIESSPLLSELRERGTLTILTIYPDEDLASWREYLSELPTEWINGYDHGMKLTEERLYNLNAIPSLYLLDSAKRVLIKDGTSVAEIEDTIAFSEVR